AAAMIGVKPVFGDKSVAEGDKAAFDVVFVAPDGKQLARDGLRYELLKIESRYQWYRQNSSWEYEPVKSTTRVADGDLTIAADKPSRVTLAPQPGRYRLDVKSAEADGPLTSVQFDVGWYSDGSADTPDLLETSIDRPEYQSGDTMVVSVNARSAGKLTSNVLGQRRMTSEIRDLYGQLIDGMQGSRGQLKTGGDAAGAELQGTPPTQKPLALYSGIVTVGPDGSAEISFDIPDFAGTARVMAVAWNSTKLGRATIDVTVRDPVVLTATLPRFLLNGDKGTMSFDLDNVEGAPGDYSISVTTSGPVKVTGNPTTTVKLAAKQRTSMALALDAGGAGAANLD